MLSRAAAILIAFLGLTLAFPAPAQERQPAVDIWVLAMSWSPSFCAGKAGASEPDQCSPGKKYGFIVHGLWPQQMRGARTDCPIGAGVPKEVADRMMAVMPSRTLIEHEWTRHGACSGMSAAEYFTKTRAAFDKVKIPAAFKDDKPDLLPVAQVEKLFGDINPALKPDAIAVVCRGGTVADVRVCLDKDLNFRSCPSRVADRCKDDVAFAPPR